MPVAKHHNLVEVHRRDEELVRHARRPPQSPAPEHRRVHRGSRDVHAPDAHRARRDARAAAQRPPGRQHRRREGHAPGDREPDQVAADAYGCTLIGEKPDERRLPQDGARARHRQHELASVRTWRSDWRATARRADLRADPLAAVRIGEALDATPAPAPASWRCRLGRDCQQRPRQQPASAAEPPAAERSSASLEARPPCSQAKQDASGPAPAFPRAPSSACWSGRAAARRRASSRCSSASCSTRRSAAPSRATRTSRVRLPLPVEAFLLADPFVAAMTLLVDPRRLPRPRWSLVVLALTLVFGRVFCGWICPFGTLHHFFGWIFPRRYVKGNQRVEANKTHWWQRGKYYMMYGFLGAAAGRQRHRRPVRSDLRRRARHRPRRASRRSSTSASAAPTRAAEHATSAPCRPRSDGAQDVLAQTVWTAKQAYFHQTWFIVFLLVADPVHEPLHPAVLVPRALPARRVPRRDRRASPCSAWRRITPSAPTAICASCTARAPTARRAA